MKENKDRREVPTVNSAFEANVRLCNLPWEQQKYIAEKYYNGKMPWLPSYNPAEDNAELCIDAAVKELKYFRARYKDIPYLSDVIEAIEGLE